MMPTPRRRVLHVIDSFDLGGAQSALLNLLRFADRTRYEFHVACMHGRGVFWSEFAALGLPVHSLSPRKWLPVYLARLARLIRQERFDIVHCHLFGANWIAKPLAALLKVPVRINHDQCNDAVRHENIMALRLDRWTNRCSSHVCAVSVSTREFLLRHERLPPERVSVVYNGVDLQRFAPQPGSERRDDRFVVLGVGRLHPQKDFHLFLEVAADLLRRNRAMSFRIAGTGPQLDALRAHAAHLDIAAQVDFTGHIDDMPSLYAQADALMITSAYEGTPLTALEAMAMRLPIVASRIDGLAEILVDQDDALLVTPGDPQGFVTQISRLMADPQLRCDLIDAAARKVRECYSAEAMCAQVQSIYAKCLARRDAQSQRK